MKKKKLRALVRRWAKPGPMGPQGVAGKDLSEEVRDLGERVRRIEEVMGKKLVGKIMKGM